MSNDKFQNAVDEVIPRMSIVKVSERFNIYSVQVKREVFVLNYEQNVLFESPMINPIINSTSTLDTFKKEPETIINDLHERRLWTYEENRKFLEAS